MDMIQRVFAGITKNIWVVGAMIGVNYIQNWLMIMPMVANTIRDPTLRLALFEGLGDVAKHEVYGVLADKTGHM